jgi:hypothetical protein
MRPSRLRLRAYVRAVRLLLHVLTRIDSWHFERHYRRIDAVLLPVVAIYIVPCHPFLAATDAVHGGNRWLLGPELCPPIQELIAATAGIDTAFERRERAVMALTDAVNAIEANCANESGGRNAVEPCVGAYIP